jgi:transposase-like protein
MTKKTTNRISPEVRQQAVRLVLEHGGDHASQWAAFGSTAGKIGCTVETLRKCFARPSVTRANGLVRPARSASA